MLNARLLPRNRRSMRRPSLQAGMIAFVTLLFLGIVIGISLYGLLRPANVELEDMKQTERALAQAKEALIAYASGRPSTNRPGELPCPDRTNNGQATPPNCNTPANQIGRLPWLTLGIPDLRDGSGERLWYAVSSNFKNATAVTPLNSNTPGQLTVTGIAPANNVIAIVFAPGPVVAGQSRNPAILTELNNVANYLEGENANGNTIFTTGPASGVFNDRLLAITPAMFFPQVEARVAREAASFLRQHFVSFGFYPVADAYGGVALCTPSNQGKIPPTPLNCGSGQQPFGSSVPSWFFNNNWQQVLFYAAAPACTNPVATGCTGSGGFLSVNGTNGVRALIGAPGVPYAGQNRPCAAISDCLEAPNTTSFPVFTYDVGISASNDKFVVVAP